MRRNFKPWLAAAVLAAVTPVAIAQGSASSSTLGQQNALLKKEVAALRRQLQQRDAICPRPEATTNAKTLKQWHDLLVGKHDRSQVIGLLGAPGKAMSGFLWYDNLVLDADTGQRHTLQIAFLDPTLGDSGKITHVTYF